MKVFKNYIKNKSIFLTKILSSRGKMLGRVKLSPPTLCVVVVMLCLWLIFTSSRIPLSSHSSANKHLQSIDREIKLPKSRDHDLITAAANFYNNVTSIGEIIDAQRHEIAGKNFEFKKLIALTPEINGQPLQSCKFL